MKAFQFRLQPLLNIKTLEKENLQEVYRKAKQALKEREEELKSLQTKKEDCLDAMEVPPGDTIDPVLQTGSWHFIEKLSGNIQDVHRDVHRHKEGVQERHRELLDKLKEEKSLEKLKEKKAKLHNEEVLRVMQRDIDEMGQQLYYSNKELD